MRTDSILKALDIDTDRYPVLFVVGGGGKSAHKNNNTHGE